MISPLLDPNQIPLVRASERRGIEALPRSFDQVASLDATGRKIELPAIEIEMQDAHGASRRIALPWGLAANDRLSQQGAGPITDTQQFLRLQLGVGQPATTNDLPVAGMLTGAYPSSGPASMRGAPAPVPTTLPLPPVQMDELLQSASRPSPAKAMGEFGLPWQERWLQWLGDDGGNLRVRLRDYRLSEAEHDQLLEQLHLIARDQGLTLTRLTVNGRELWRVPVKESGVAHGR